LRSIPTRRIAGCAAIAVLALAASASAQQLILKGAFGMNGGVMPPPGLYAGMFGAVNWQDKIVGPSPDKIVVDGPDVTQEVFGPVVQYVSGFKIFGADYGAMLVVPIANIAFDFPRLDLNDSSGLALSQLWVVPVMLGWHHTGPLFLAPGGADFTFHYAFYPVTGRYTAGAKDNTSLGMFVHELSFRLTSYFDKDRKWQGSASLFYDFNGNKKDQDWKTGNPFTYMWGLGRTYGSSDSLFSGWVGATGYAQFQVTSTTGVDAPEIVRDNKSQVMSIGPEFATLKGALVLRYFWQFGGKFTTRGQGFFLQFAMPLPI
jgi:hypothetical protein